MTRDGSTFEAIARRCLISERSAKRDTEAAQVRHRMHLEVGLDRDHRHELVLPNSARPAPGLEARARPPRRFPDVLSQHDQAPIERPWPALSCAGARSGRCPPKGTRMQVLTSPSLIVEELERHPSADVRGAQLLHDEALPIVDAAIVAAIQEVFTDAVVMANPALLAIYTHHLSRFVPPGFGDSCFNLYARAVRSEESRPLCELLRAPELIQDLEAAARSITTATDPCEPHAVAQQRAADAARLRYQRAIAELHAKRGDELAAPAQAILDALDHRRRLDVARKRHEASAQAAAEQAAAEARAAQDLADQAADQAAAEVLISERRRLAGLPADLVSGVWYEQQAVHCLVMATAERRLRATKLDSVRLGLRGTGRGLYACGDLARSLGNLTLDELRTILQQLDAGEREVTS